MALLIKNARVVNAGGEEKDLQDILLEGGRIARMAPSIEANGAEVIDAAGKKVLPGFIDLHVHLREPGREDKETIESGSRAAVKGGFTSIFCMPNTTPAIDTAQTVQYILDQARKVGLVNVFPVGAITKNRAGVEITEMMDLRRAGCLGVSDDGRGLMNAGLMRRALEYAKMADLLVMQHCEDDNLSAKGVMNEGALSTLLGLKGDPVIAETVIIARDIELARYLHTRVHFMHVSAARSVDLIRRAKAEGIQVSCEATPHHFTLTEEEVRSFDTSTKVNPPLRGREDVLAIKAGLKDGTIDCIATDHAPHTHEDKEVEYDGAPPGLIGLETAFALAFQELVAAGVLTLPQLAGKMSLAPARLMGLANKGELAVGKDADIVILDMEREWQVSKEDTASRSRNSPFIGWNFKGRVSVTICGGKVVYTDARTS
ncbi:MAG: dihydroorotase [Candidatus Omnitrophica bacterium]|nr:dihydroorotase [Candidatus Omnitrophota bacterium]